MKNLLANEGTKRGNTTKISKIGTPIMSNSNHTSYHHYGNGPKIKKLTKDQREIIKQRNAIPFIQNISFAKFGSCISQCNVCGGQYSLLELAIPNCCTYTDRLHF